jgi:hypothetical protein
MDLVMVLWFIEQAAVIAWKGQSYEAKAINSIFCKLMPKSYVDWRTEKDLHTDIQLGMWIGWLGWIIIPMLIPQGISATARTGMFGVMVATFWALGIIFCIGLVTLIIRLVASWGGPISRAFGKYGQPEFARIMGALMVPVSLWMLIHIIIGLSLRGII